MSTRGFIGCAPSGNCHAKATVHTAAGHTNCGAIAAETGAVRDRERVVQWQKAQQQQALHDGCSSGSGSTTAGVAAIAATMAVASFFLFVFFSLTLSFFLLYMLNKRGEEPSRLWQQQQQ